MRIAFLASADNIHTRRWAKYLASCGHDLTILCDRQPENPLEGIHLVHPEMRLATKILAFKLFPKPYGNNFFKRFPYKRELLRLRPDIVHAFEALGYGYALAHCGTFPKVLTPWGNDILYDPAHSRIARFLVSRALRAADVITTNYVELADHLTQDFAIPQSKIRPFSWGVDLTIFHPGYSKEAETLRQKLSLPPAARIILSNRMMKPYWGIGVIADALPAVFREIPEAHAIFLRGAGDAAFENEVREGFRRAGILERVRFVPEYLTEKEMATFLNLAEAFVSCPSTDLLSISVLEGMACGCAPVLADLDAYRTRIRHGENGLIFRPGDSADLAEKLTILLRHPEWKPRFAGINIPLINEKDNWHKNAPRLVAIYKELLRMKKLNR
ncbi:MAG: glycosyltransferase family 4 protein [Candidatus Sumerlaeota bacterium]|nr:glycosyltransferase family 4 protein [Candidatus Sumerlaeota bacterium]